MKETDCERERERTLQGWDRVELMPVMEWCVPGPRILYLLVEKSISGERSCGMIDR